jgi:L-ribulose-5-phosphate 4-epimerase
MLEQLKEQVWRANLELDRAGLVTLTWGNVSGIDREQGLVVIKPSGVSYAEMRAEHMVVVDLDGRRVDGTLNPSSDTPTHVILYKAFGAIGGVTHTHSAYASMFAQACREIPCLGTTHADVFFGAVPLARALTEKEVAEAYETNTGKVIVERFAGLSPVEIPGVLAAHHGPFAWGKSAADSVHNAIALEAIAKMAFGTLLLNPQMPPLPRHIANKHYTRKHGPHAYYGQK